MFNFRRRLYESRSEWAMVRVPCILVCGIVIIGELLGVDPWRHVSHVTMFGQTR